MAKLEQVLLLDPPTELRFKGPYSEVKTSYLKLTNPTDRNIGFKVKTTAPKTYCVRPNGGVIQPKQEIKVAVMLQPFDPVNDDRSRDKFMVQSIYVPEGDVNTDTMWHDVGPEGLMNSKLKCIFDFFTKDQNATLVQAPVDVVDQSKTKAKVSHIQEVKATDAEPESARLYKEFKNFQADLAALRTENAALKEEGMRLRMSSDTRTKGTSARPTESEPHHPAAKNQLIPNNYLILIAVLVFMLGIYIGKSIL